VGRGLNTYTGFALGADAGGRETLSRLGWEDTPFFSELDVLTVDWNYLG